MTIGFAMCGSFCTFSRVFPVMEAMAKEHTVIPIFSHSAATLDSRFGTAEEHLRRAEAICGRPVLTLIPEAEPIGPKKLLDVLVIAPCTGNTLSKLAHGIADGPVTMAAFAAAVKIDTFAYLPVQDFGNAFSTFAAQNYGAGNKKRLAQGLKTATILSCAFSLAISALVWVFAPNLMGIFIKAEETAVIASGVGYLRLEGAFYALIGCLFLLYGFYRAVKKPGMSVVLTVISLGLRVVLAYALSPTLGENGIWMAIPIGWAAADVIGYSWYFLRKKALLPSPEGR